jgi:hypothetical protein
MPRAIFKLLRLAMLCAAGCLSFEIAGNFGRMRLGS